MVEDEEMRLRFKNRKVQEECEVLMHSNLQINAIGKRLVFLRLLSRGLVTKKSASSYVLTALGIRIRNGLLLLNQMKIPVDK